MTALSVRHSIFDKWKILIHNDQDRKTFEAELVGLHQIATQEGKQKGYDQYVEEARKQEASSKLPLERNQN